MDLYREFAVENLRAVYPKKRRWLCFENDKAIYKFSSAPRISESWGDRRPFSIEFNDVPTHVTSAALETLVPFLGDLLTSPTEPLNEIPRWGRYADLRLEPKVDVNGLAFFNFRGNLVLAARPYPITRIPISRVDAEAIHFIFARRLNAGDAPSG